MKEKNNIFDEVNNSIKAKLYDSAHTPFMSSFIISWILINHKYLMIYFSDAIIENKLNILNNFDKDKSIEIYDAALIDMHFLGLSTHFFWYPLLIALFYVFVYPHFANIFYKYTGEMANKKKLIRLDYEKKKAISDTDKQEIYLDNYNLTTKVNQLKVEISKLDTQYKKDLSVETEKNIKLISLNKELNEQIVSQNSLISENDLKANKIITLENELKEKDSLVKNLKELEKINKENQNSNINQAKKLELLSTANATKIETINALKTEIEKLTNENLLCTENKKQKLLEQEKNFMQKFNIDADSFIVLKTIYSNSIESNLLSLYVSKINNSLQWSKFKIETIINKLVDSKLLSIRTDSYKGVYYDINNIYKEEIVKVYEI